MSPDSAKYGRNWQDKRRRVKAEIAAGWGVCRLCGQRIHGAERWSLSREADGPIHSRCGFERGLLGNAASTER